MALNLALLGVLLVLRLYITCMNTYMYEHIHNIYTHTHMMYIHSHRRRESGSESDSFGRAAGARAIYIPVAQDRAHSLAMTSVCLSWYMFECVLLYVVYILVYVLYMCHGHTPSR